LEELSLASDSKMFPADSQITGRVPTFSSASGRSGSWTSKEKHLDKQERRSSNARRSIWTSREGGVSGQVRKEEKLDKEEQVEGRRSIWTSREGGAAGQARRSI
jgi:hypothetical protein